MILDDFDSRPGSATSLLRTIVGAHLREVGGWVSIADLITLMGAAGVSPVSTRSAVLRVKTKGLLAPQAIGARAGYRLNPDAVPMLELGDRRIFSFRQQGDNDQWCLISYSIPETQRDARHQLRRRLGWIGCGAVSTGLWICPSFLAGEVDGILSELGLRDSATLFITATPQTAGTLADAAARWWDLDRLRALHRAFLANHGGAVPEPVDGQVARISTPAVVDRPACSVSVPEPVEAFARYIAALDEWRILPYLDPGLPPSALPEDWPGFESVALFGTLTATLAGPARGYVESVVG